MNPAPELFTLHVYWQNSAVFFFFLCEAPPSSVVTLSENAKCHHERPKNPPAFSRTSFICLFSRWDPDMAFPCTGGGGEAHLGQGLWGEGEPWPGVAGGNIFFPCQSSSFGSAIARSEWSRLFPNPDKHLETCTSKPRLFGQSSCSGSKLLLCEFCKALPGAWLTFVLARAFSEGVLGWLFLGTWSNMGVKTRCLKQGSDKCKKKQWKMRRQGS